MPELSPIGAHDSLERATQRLAGNAVGRLVLQIVAMGRIEPDDLGDPERIFIAASVRVARRVEEWLTTAGVNYVVQVEPFGRSAVFNTVRNGAAFYVTAGQAAYCREQLTATGLGGGVVEEQD